MQFPLNVGGDKEFQISTFFSQDFLKRLSYSTLFNYNLRRGVDTYYFEPQVSFTINSKLKLFLEGRSGGTIDDKLKIEPVVGLKFLIR